MEYYNKIGKVSESPTRPGHKYKKKHFDIADLYSGPVSREVSKEIPEITQNLDEKLRKAYFWITNYAIITPFYDIEYNDKPPKEYIIGDRKSKIILPSGQSYSSFVLLENF